MYYKYAWSCCFASASLANQARPPLMAINCLVPWGTEAIPRVCCSRPNGSEQKERWGRFGPTPCGVWVHPPLRVAPDRCMPGVESIAMISVRTKVYRLGGESDSAILWRKRTARDVVERFSGSWLLRTFLKLSLKMPSIFCEFVCYKRKLCVNNPISLFSYNTGPHVNKKMTRQQLK